MITLQVEIIREALQVKELELVDWNKTCFICMEGPLEKSMRCGHHFCEKCFDLWTNGIGPLCGIKDNLRFLQRTCPLCRGI